MYTGPPPNNGKLEAARVGRKNSVRWLPYVEEKIIVSHPDEHLHPDEQLRPDDDRDDNSQQSSVESLEEQQPKKHGWLESRLKQFDEEAERFLKSDSLEQGISNVQKSIGSFIGNIKKKNSNDSDEATAMGSFDESSNHTRQKDPSNMKFVMKLRDTTNLFRKEFQQQTSSVGAFQSGRPRHSLEQSKTSLIHSPCSVIGQFVNDVSGGTAGLCGLNDIVLRDDDLTEYTGDV